VSPREGASFELRDEGSGSLSQSFLKRDPELAAEVILPLRMTSTMSLSTLEVHFSKHRDTYFFKDGGQSSGESG